MRAKFKKHRLEFKRPSGTSRGVLTTKDSWFLIIEENGKTGLGECSLIEGLSPDNHLEIESLLQTICAALESKTKLPELTQWPAVQMGLESALLGIQNNNQWELFPSEFTRGEAHIPINGLVWMGKPDYMKTQINSLLDRGFDCIKLKIGALDFKQELEVLHYLRKQYDSTTISIRVDANGAFAAEDALDKLQQLERFAIHSIEQPIGVNQWEEMADLCKRSPVPIALDEELISRTDNVERKRMLELIQPQFIILKPSLLGGFKASKEWISHADSLGIDWWVTSALESNVGLNAIAQWTYSLNAKGPQGLGTGSLFTNNIQSPLVIDKACLSIDNSISWDLI